MGYFETSLFTEFFVTFWSGLTAYFVRLQQSDLSNQVRSGEDFLMTDQHHLEQVSRSFAVSIQALSEPLRDYVSLAYLLCRVVDTIEDSKWPNPELQSQAFGLFEEFLLRKPSLSQFEGFQSLFPKDIPSAEYELVQDSYQLFLRYHMLPGEIRNCLQNPILSMSRGMKFFVFRDLKKLKLSNLLEVNQYCFFVAGVVGEMLTNLVAKIPSSSKAPPVLSLTDAYHFALFLQKVNILKDKKSDEESGRFLVPEVSQLWHQLEQHAEHAFNYVEKLPKHLDDFKLFCSWALFLGLNTLSDLVLAYENSVGKKLFDQNESKKMSREQAMSLFSQLQQTIASGVSLGELYQHLRAEFVTKLHQIFPHTTAKPSLICTSNAVTPSPVETYYSGRLNHQELNELGMIR